MRKSIPSVLTLPLLSILFYSQSACAGLIQYFKDEQGDTKWQYVANFSSGVLILLLSVAFITLFFSHRRTEKANHALKEIRDRLEQRVQERTATLNESNRLLEESSELLQSSEAYIKNILESMPLMLIGLDEAMNITQWNEHAEESTGVSNEAAMGQNLWEAYPTITVSPSQITQVLEEAKSITVKHCQRGQYYFDITIYPLHEQIETGVVILIDDVTQRILAENMLIQRDKMSSMGELASTMAHDIDIPLQAILTDLNAVQETLSQSDANNHSDTTDQTSNGLIDMNRVQDLLSDAANKGQQACAVISNLLNFSGSHGDKKSTAQMSEIVEHTIELAGDVLSEPSGLRFRDIKIDRHYEEGLPDIPIYVSELQQVFLSLFRHACHSLGQMSEENFEPTIRIDIFECYSSLWIKVQHNGVGLSSEEQQYIFEPFFNNAEGDEKADAAKRLSFSYFIITEHHQGQIAVTSDPKVGTTFHIQLEMS